MMLNYYIFFTLLVSVNTFLHTTVEIYKYHMILKYVPYTQFTKQKGVIKCCICPLGNYKYKVPDCYKDNDIIPVPKCICDTNKIDLNCPTYVYFHGDINTLEYSFEGINIYIKGIKIEILSYVLSPSDIDYVENKITCKYNNIIKYN